MGQKIGRLPDTWGELMEEKDRVLRWSLEVLGKIDDNIKAEDAFLVDYDNAKIDEKVNLWMDNQKHKWETAISRNPQQYPRNVLKTEVKKVTNDIRREMRMDYRNAYARVKKLTKAIDAMGIDERKIHQEIQYLETLCNNDVKLFAKKFGPLRKKVFENLRETEKMVLEDKKLKVSFTRKIYRVDQKYMEECAKRINMVIKNFEICAEMNST